MELTVKQAKGLDIAIKRYKNKEKYTTISGYAGTGKSTLVSFIIKGLAQEGISPEKDVAYAAFTGKAAEVLRKKGNPNALTLHKLLYDHIPKPNGGFIRKPKVALEYKIIVVDEVSLVPKSMIDMLLRHNVYVIFLGDPFQLPQIDKNEAHDILDYPHIFLDEIMRQAAESEIIRLTLQIREGKDIPFTKGEEVAVMPKRDLCSGHLLWADQILCATNKERNRLNAEVRRRLGYEGLPQDGEKLICLKNYWDIITPDGNALVNGTTGIIHNPYENFIIPPRSLRIETPKIEFISCSFIPEVGMSFNNLMMYKKMGEPCLSWKDAYKLNGLKEKLGKMVPDEFAFGYAITGWKAQGSEWDHVLAIEERFPFDKKEHARFLYTVCTRASKKLVLVRDK